jgi:copper(I)-binding protein
VNKYLALIVAGSLALAACGGDEGSKITMPTVPIGAEIAVVSPWARNSPMGASVGAAYLVITSPIDDELVGISVPADVAARTELHETVAMGAEDDEAKEDQEDHGNHDHSSMPGGMMPGGMMTMRQVGSIELPAGKMVMLQPGGLHIMLLDLAQPLALGSSFTATLNFAVADPIEVTFEVRDIAP